MRRTGARVARWAIVAGIFRLRRRGAVSNNQRRAVVAVTEMGMQWILPGHAVAGGESLAEFRPRTRAIRRLVEDRRNRPAPAIALEVAHRLVALADADR